MGWDSVHGSPAVVGERSSGGPRALELVLWAGLIV